MESAPRLFNSLELQFAGGEVALEMWLVPYIKMTFWTYWVKYIIKINFVCLFLLLKCDC
jgi:hypothetical protein